MARGKISPEMRRMQSKLKDCAADWRKGKKSAATYRQHVTKCLRNAKK